jgi:hypothetical protein
MCQDVPKGKAVGKMESKIDLFGFFYVERLSGRARNSLTPLSVVALVGPCFFSFCLSSPPQKFSFVLFCNEERGFPLPKNGPVAAPGASAPPFRGAAFGGRDCQVLHQRDARDGRRARFSTGRVSFHDPAPPLFLKNIFPPPLLG